jgi:glycosyltransferase involved in cell wall biosynthesis
MKISVIYSNYNRSDLMEAGLHYLARQSMSPEEFEVVIVDDGSEEDYEPICEAYADRLRIQWVRYDHTRHPIFAELNPGGRAILDPPDEPLWYHTPAISHNLGMRHARGEVICITQPEVLFHPDCLQRGYDAATGKKRLVFGMPYMSTPEFRVWVLEARKEGRHIRWSDLKKNSGHTGGGDGGENFRYYAYWWIAFVQSAAIFRICGVDEEYQRGVYGEDDDFRVRLERDRWHKIYHKTAEGIHLDHSHLGGHWDRNGERWKQGGEVNRKRYDLVRRRQLPVAANQGRVWGDPALVTRHEVYDRVGESDGE